MADRLPPLTALRAFEAAARHMSFARAADELFVTPAALSYQIKSLETALGQPLFRRLNRAVELTEAGRLLAPGTADAFATLSATWRNVKRLQDDTTLTVTAGPAFTSKWLAPRLYDFAQSHPEIELRFAASLRFADFARDEVDVAIRFSGSDDPSLFNHPLLPEWVSPVMTPAIAETIRTPADLAKLSLIHDDSISFFRYPCDWPAWCRAEGVTLDTAHGPRFSQADHAIDAALAGVGVALGRISLASRAIQSGQLVAPFATTLVAEAQFRFVCPIGHEKRPHIAAFKSWVESEIAATRGFADGRRLIASTDVPPS